MGAAIPAGFRYVLCTVTEILQQVKLSLDSLEPVRCHVLVMVNFRSSDA